MVTLNIWRMVEHPEEVPERSLSRVGTVSADNFSCAIGLCSKSSNNIEFSASWDGCTINPGDMVTWNDTVYGGIIMKKDIDFSKKIIKYYGTSIYGMLNHWVSEWGTVDAQIAISSATDQSETANRLNGPAPYFRYVFEKLGIGILSNLEDPIPDIPQYYSIRVDSPCGSLCGDIFEKFFEIYESWEDFGNEKFNYQGVIEPNNSGFDPEYADYDSLSYKMRWKIPEKYSIDLTDSAQKDIFITEEFKVTEIFDHSTAHFVNSDNDYESHLISTLTDYDLKYPDMLQYGEWNPNDESNLKNRMRLKQRREEQSKNLQTTITIHLVLANRLTRVDNYHTEDYANIGDLIKLIYKGKIEAPYRMLVEKILTIQGNSAKIEYNLG